MVYVTGQPPSFKVGRYLEKKVKGNFQHCPNSTFDRSSLQEKPFNGLTYIHINQSQSRETSQWLGSRMNGIKVTKISL